MKFSYSIVALAVIAASAFGQVLSGFPSCANNCITSLPASCGDDIACICQDNYFAGLPPCVATVCPAAQQGSALLAASELCASAGVTLPPPPGGPPPPSYSAPPMTSSTLSTITASSTSSLTANSTSSTSSSTPSTITVLSTSSPTAASAGISTNTSTQTLLPYYPGLTVGDKAGIGIGVSFGFLLLFAILLNPFLQRHLTRQQNVGSLEEPKLSDHPRDPTIADWTEPTLHDAPMERTEISELPAPQPPLELSGEPPEKYTWEN